MELSKDKQPPEKYWFDEDYLQEWFDNISEGASNTVAIDPSDIE